MIQKNEKWTVVEEVAEMLRNRFSNKKGPHVIAVGGPGGTGKTSFCSDLERALDEAVVLRLDDYKTDRAERKRKKLFGPHPAANDLSKIRDHITRLKKKKKIKKPVYDAAIGRVEKTELFKPARFTILDGEVATYEEFKEVVDLSIFIDAHLVTQLYTRLTRDLEDRGYSREKAWATFFGSNVSEFEKYGQPTKDNADIVLFCDHDYSLRIEAANLN